MLTIISLSTITSIRILFLPLYKGKRISKFKRLSEKERKIQICNAAKDVFLKKGFSRSNMEDVIEASGMSKGGVYNYYKNLSEIMYDIMIQGMEYRFGIVEESIKKYKQLSGEDLFVEVLIDKMLDYNEFKPIYAMFMMEIKREDKFKKLYERIQNDSIDMLIDFAIENKWEHMTAFSDDFGAALVSSVILGVEILDSRETFLNNRKAFRAMIKAYMDYIKEEKKDG